MKERIRRLVSGILLVLALGLPVPVSAESDAQRMREALIEEMKNGANKQTDMIFGYNEELSEAISWDGVIPIRFPDGEEIILAGTNVLYAEETIYAYLVSAMGQTPYLAVPTGEVYAEKGYAVFEVIEGQEGVFYDVGTVSEGETVTAYFYKDDINNMSRCTWNAEECHDMEPFTNLVLSPKEDTSELVVTPLQPVVLMNSRNEVCGMLRIDKEGSVYAYAFATDEEIFYGAGSSGGNETEVWTSDEGIKFTGSKTDGVIDGYGMAEYPNGDYYKGEFEKGIRNGTGAYHWASGSWYEGEFKDGELNGTGENHWANGSWYEGEFKDGKRNGNGVNYYVSGDHYEGEFKDDKCNGEGTYYFVSGDRYEGEFKNGKRDGEGTMYFKDGTSKTGIWKEDVYQGETP